MHIFYSESKNEKNTLKNSFFCWQWPLVWQRVCLHWRIFSWLICDCLTFVIVWRIFSWLICDCLTATYKTCFCFDVVLLPITFCHNDRQPTDRSTFDFRTTMTTSVGKSRHDQRCERCSLYMNSYLIMTFKNIGI